MDWLNLNVSVLDSPEVIGAHPVDRATWLFALRYCIGQENSGRIVGCANWPDRRWQQTVRVTLREIRRECDLWTWEEEDLVVRFYPTEKQAEIIAKRAAGRATAVKRWGKQGSSSGSSAISTRDAEGEGEGEVEGEEEGKRTREARRGPPGEFPSVLRKRLSDAKRDLERLTYPGGCAHPARLDGDRLAEAKRLSGVIEKTKTDLTEAEAWEAQRAS